MIFRKRFLLIPLAAVAVAVLSSSVALIYRDWRAGYSTRDVYVRPVNWPLYYAEITARKLWRSLFDEGETGLPQVRLYLPRQGAAALVANIPDSTKIYQRAYLLQPDGSLGRIQLRYRGDNPINWLFEKKSIRMKLRKSEMRNDIRVFNYTGMQSPDLLGEYISFELARRMGVIAPRSRAVELFINDESRGVSIESERYDETFLRNRGIMPVNLYKGEQFNADLVPGTGRNLFENASFWTKTATYNVWQSSEHKDLSRFLRLLNLAGTGPKAFDRFLEAAPLKAWAEFAAYLALVRSSHNDDVHNMRLLSDVWRGHVLPLAFETPFSSYETSGYNALFDGGSNEILRVLHQSSDFLNKKYHSLYSRVEGQRILDPLREELSSQREGFLISTARDVDLISLHYYSGYARSAVSAKNMATVFDDSLKRMSDIQARITTALKVTPQVSWDIDGSRFSLLIDAYVPASEIELSATLPPEIEHYSVVWDRNSNRRIDEGDIQIPIRYDKSKIILDLSLFANRIPRHDWQHGRVAQAGISIQPTRFDFLISQAVDVHSVFVRNPFTNERVDASKGVTEGFPPTILNRPVFPSAEPLPVIWSGDVRINEDRVIRYPVLIRPGTRIRLARGASLVFRARVQALGTTENPIEISSAEADVNSNPSSAWGVVALQGQGTQGSKLQHMVIGDGSGDEIDSIVYTGMLSIHDSRNIDVSHVRLRRNHIADDSLHLVYANDVRLRGIYVENANGDGIDIDISQVFLDGILVRDSKNDGIDLMSSRVALSNVKVLRSGDKGISVGERTRVLVNNASLISNKTGMESKDDSEAIILHSTLTSNEVQLNAFKKNWRYGSGGRIEAYMTRFESPKNVISAKKESRISINRSLLDPRPTNLGRRIELPATKIHASELKKRLDSFHLDTAFLKQEIPFDIERMGNLSGVGGDQR